MYSEKIPVQKKDIQEGRLSPVSTHRRLFVIGKVSPGLLNSLTTRWLASLAHHYETVDSLQEFGELTLRKADFNTLLIGTGVTADERRHILNIIEERPNEIVVGVMTAEPSYESWLPIAPMAAAQGIADTLQFVARIDPAQTIIVSSTKGGVGKSTVSTNLAIALAQLTKADGSHYRVALIDDDRTTRSVRSLMGIEESARTTSDLVTEVNSARGVVTRQIVEKYLVEAHGVKSLVGPHTIITDFPIEIDTAKDVLAIMGLELGFDFIIIDSPPDFINTSSFTYGILRDSTELPRPPLILLPVIPEKILLRSVDDTLTALTHFHHPVERILPVINCLRPTHDPESIRGNGILWQEPVGIIPYMAANQFVGETGVPVLAQNAEGVMRQMTRSLILGQTTVRDTQNAFSLLARHLIEFVENADGDRLN